MRSQSNFLKLSCVLLVGALLILSGLSGTNVQANQATMAATMGMNGGMMSTMMATMGMNGGMMGTMSADSAYPPCPTAMMGTPGMMGTMMATMSGMMGTPGMMGTMMATKSGMMGTPGMMATMAPMVVGPYAENNGCKLSATLSGANEVPGPGDPDGKGTATVSITRGASGTGTICFKIDASGITLPAAAAHIHMGEKGKAGPVVVPFAPPDAKGTVSGCTSGVDRELIEYILTEPAEFYVNVHTSDFPNGALRGQLTAAAG